ncbi:sec1 family domain-containing protein 2, partial [Silurus meridionalis]
SAEVFTSFPRRMWEKVASRVNNAVVFVDDACAESLHWSGGAELLFDAGARNVKRFSSFEAGAADEPEAVFVVGTTLKGRTADVIRDVVALSRFQRCAVITAAAPTVHLLLADGVSAEPEGDAAFARFEDKLRAWMGGPDRVAEVAHVPLHFARASSQLLIAPAFAELFPLLEADLAAVNRKRPEKRRFSSLADLDVHSLPNELQIQIRALASSLNALFEFANTREESFTVGPMSRLIAAELANHPQAKNRRKSAAQKASVVFIDRTLDLTGAVGHHGDNLVEKILSVLPPLPGHVTDVQVDMLELTHLQHTPEDQGVLAPGCLGQTQSAAAQSLWETILIAKQKEAVMEVRRQLVEAASKEKLPIKMGLGRVTGEQLFTYVRLFRDSWPALENHCGLLQLALGTAQTLLHPALAQWDACLAFERLLLQALGESALADVLKQFLPLMKSSGTKTGSDSGQADFSVDELLLLLVYVYSLAQETQARGTKNQEKVEREIIGALTLLMTQQTTLSPTVQGITGVSNPEELMTDRVHAALERMFETLRSLGRTREHLKRLRSVYSPGDGAHQATYHPFIKQVLEEIFDPSRPECQDIEHASGGITDLLKTGFSMFMKVNRPHPSDHSLLFLFMVGGVTASELRMIREVVSTHKPGTRVSI